MRLELSDYFLPPMQLFLLQLGQAAHHWGSRAFIVGGLPRDLLRGVKLGKGAADLDILIEGDAVSFARELKGRWNELSSLKNLPPPVKHVGFKRYGTAKLVFATELFPGVAQIDFASTRSESYPTPGGAPIVELSDLQSDLGRRDFSINSIAIELSPDNSGLIHDPFAGIDHLQEGRLSVLHPRSFIDDPARLIRAVRFATRLDFRLDTGTEKLFFEAIAARCLDTLPALRRQDELRKALTEPAVTPVVLKLAEVGMLEQLMPEIRFTEGMEEQLRRLDNRKASEIITAADYQKILAAG